VTRSHLACALLLLAATARADPPSASFAPLTASELCVTSGSLAARPEAGWRVTSASLRAVAARAGGDAAVLRFVSLGPSRGTRPLGSGELRRQIGLKLRAQDGCNLLYVMWRQEPAPGVFVSVKRNPGMTRHAQCGDHGYRQLGAARAVARVVAGAPHELGATLEGRVLTVKADAEVVWRGELPAEALELHGPPGVRSDNEAFDFTLLAPPAAPGACPTKD
jgi:hypothetical protein